jgi:hypothetical protein
MRPLRAPNYIDPAKAFQRPLKGLSKGFKRPFKGLYMPLKMPFEGLFYIIIVIVIFPLHSEPWVKSPRGSPGYNY